MDNPIALQRIALLGLLVGPLVAALFCAYLGKNSNRGIAFMARLFALLHLGVATVVALTMAISLSDLGRGISERNALPSTTFMPNAVPGDPGIRGSSETQGHRSTWDLFSVQRLPSSLANIEEPTAIQFFLGLDGLNIWLVWLTSFLTLIGILVSERNITERLGSFYGWVFVLQSMVIGAFTAFDLVLFYVFFELTLIPAFFLIGQWGVGSSRRDAARKFFLYTLCGSLLTLTGAIGLVVTNPIPVYGSGDQLTISPKLNIAQSVGQEPQRGPLTFSIPLLIKNSLTWAVEGERKVTVSLNSLNAAKKRQDDTEKVWSADRSNAAKRMAADQARDEAEKAESAHGKVLADKQKALDYQTLFFFLLMAGFAVKVPIFPFHTWLPAAYGEAPLGITLLLSGVMAKLGTYGILRVVLPLTPDACVAYGLPVFGILGALGILYAAMCAYSQRDIKLLVAYSSVSHLGLLVLGLFAFNREGLVGATLHMVNHGLSTGAMFALLAFLYDRYRTTDSTQFGGLMGKFPDYAALMMVIALASVGLPGLNNFISEMLMLSGLSAQNSRVAVGYWLLIGGAAGIFFSAWYTFTMIRKVFFGAEATPQAVEGAAAGLTSTEWVAFGTPAVLCLALGLYPQPILDTLQHDTAIVSRIGEAARGRAGLKPESEKVRTAKPTPPEEPQPKGPPGPGPKKGGGGAAAARPIMDDEPPKANPKKKSKDDKKGNADPKKGDAPKVPEVAPMPTPMKK